MEDKNFITPESEVQKTEKESTFTFPFGQILFKNLIFIIIFTIVVGALGSVYAFLKVKPSYTRTGNSLLRIELQKGNSEDEHIYTDVSLTKYYTDTICAAIKSTRVSELANELYQKDASMEKSGGVSYGSIGVSNSQGSLIIKISYTDMDKNVANDKLSKVFTAAREILNNMEAINAESIDLIETSNNYYTLSVSDSKTSVILASILLGAILAVVIACLIYLLDNKIKDVNELERISDTMIISIIDKNKEDQK